MALGVVSLMSVDLAGLWLGWFGVWRVGGEVWGLGWDLECGGLGVAEPPGGECESCQQKHRVGEVDALHGYARVRGVFVYPTA